MATPEHVEAVRAVLEELRQAGVEEFSRAEVQAQSPILSEISVGQIGRILDDLWKGGEEIHPDTLGGREWRFGYKPYPKRRPIGR